MYIYIHIKVNVTVCVYVVFVSTYVYMLFKNTSNVKSDYVAVGLIAILPSVNIKISKRLYNIITPCSYTVFFLTSSPFLVIVNVFIVYLF